MDFIVDLMKEYPKTIGTIFGIFAVILTYSNIKEMILTGESDKEGMYFSRIFRSWSLVIILLMFTFYLFFII